jgi:indolepyruvate decarboxylase
MSKQKVADFLFDRIKHAGVEWTFGIPGDFVLPIYAAQARSGLKTAVMNHEPSVGFAADAYGRVKGLGVAIVTYGAGGLNMVNSTAGAYAEESPLLVLSGSPETRFRGQKPQLHHCVKTFDTQQKVFAEVTEVNALIDDPTTAQRSIEHVLNTIQKTSKPGYLEFPRDLVNAEIEISDSSPVSVPGESAALHEALYEIIERLRVAKQPVLIAGAQIRRFNLLSKVIAISDAVRLPVVTSILGKASFPESHPNFVGNYFGKFGEPLVREYVESSDCIICIGAVLTEMETGGYTANLPPEKLILLNSHEVKVGFHNYENVDLKALVDQLVISINGDILKDKRFTVPDIAPQIYDSAPGADALNVGSMLDALNIDVDDQYSIICDVGDCLYAGLSIETDRFIAPGYYSSMGFGVPAAIGVQLADPSRRSIVLVGDGGFQMTGTEISTAAKLGINPVVIVFNNASYAMLRYIDQKRDYYDLGGWDHCKIAEGLGAQSARATTKSEFGQALKQAFAATTPFLIDAVISETDISPTLKRLTDHFGAKVRASIA